MAPLMVLSSASQACVQPAYQCGQVAPMKASSMQIASGTKSISKTLVSKYSLLSEERHRQSQFSSQALHLRPVRKHASVLRSTKSELASDADTGNIIDVQDAEKMQQYIAESGDKLLVVDVSTKTCGPCKLIFPKVVKMSQEYPEVLFLRILGDANSGTKALMRSWGVKGVPNFRFFKNGQLIHSHTGAKEDDLRAHFSTHYSATSNVST